MTPSGRPFARLSFRRSAVRIWGPRSLPVQEDAGSYQKPKDYYIEASACGVVEKNKTAIRDSESNGTTKPWGDTWDLAAPHPVNRSCLLSFEVVSAPCQAIKAAREGPPGRVFLSVGD